MAIFGYPMTEMGDIRVDEGALLRTLGPQVDLHRPRLTCTADHQAVERDAIDAALAEEDQRFEIDPALSAEEREDHIRMQIALETHPARARLRRVLDALRRDRRGRALRAPADGRRVDPDGEAASASPGRATR